jgi:phospholipid-binding lipoprotein MlaA
MSSLFVAIAISLAAASFQDAPSADPPAILSPAANPSSQPSPATEPMSTLAAEELALPSEEITVRARAPHPPGDPFERVNIKTYELVQKVDDNVVGPVANVYDGMPEPVRNGLHNFLKNLNEPIVFVNFLFQHKVGKASETLARFALNSVVGVAGLFDIAKRTPFKLPRRPNGFGNTLGFYGVRQGPFLYLPVIGPTTVRDLIGVIADRLLLPTVIGSPFNNPIYTIPTAIVGVFDRRSEFDDELRLARATTNPYATRRDSYLNRRQAEIDALHRHHTKAHELLGSAPPKLPAAEASPELGARPTIAGSSEQMGRP